MFELFSDDLSNILTYFSKVIFSVSNDVIGIHDNRLLLSKLLVNFCGCRQSGIRVNYSVAHSKGLVRASRRVIKPKLRWTLLGDRNEKRLLSRAKKQHHTTVRCMASVQSV